MPARHVSAPPAQHVSAPPAQQPTAPRPPAWAADAAPQAPQWAAEAAPIPSKITIFRGPLVRANRTPERLAAAVTDTVYHEIAHHFGISDARLHELQAERTGD